MCFAINLVSQGYVFLFMNMQTKKQHMKKSKMQVFVEFAALLSQIRNTKKGSTKATDKSAGKGRRIALIAILMLFTFQFSQAVTYKNQRWQLDNQCNMVNGRLWKRNQYLHLSESGRRGKYWKRIHYLYKCCCNLCNLKHWPGNFRYS